MSSMISGRLGSEMVEEGIGYNSMYLKKFHHWRTKKPGSILDRVMKQGNTVYIHNNTKWMASVIIGAPMKDEELTQHYREHQFETENATETDHWIQTTTNPNLIYTSTNPDRTFSNFVEWNNPTKKAAFYNNEAKFIKWIQEQPFEGIVWVDLTHWHEHIFYNGGQVKHMDANGKPVPIAYKDAIEDSISWLKNLDFNEPDSFFYIYADHSHRVQDFLDPPAYLTWCYTSSWFALPFAISSMDFYPITEQLFGITSQTADKQDDRVFACEDGRFNATPNTKALCFLRGAVAGDLWVSVSKLLENGLCDAGFYVMICKLDMPHTFTCFYFTTAACVQTLCYVSVFSILCDSPVAKRTKTTDVLFPIAPHEKLVSQLSNQLFKHSK
jgi:hypothetical protein